MKTTQVDGGSRERVGGKKTAPRFWLMLIALGLAYWLVMMLRQSLVAVSGPIMAELDMDAAGLGTMGAVMLYSYAAMQIPGGFLADRMGARRIITVSLLLTAAATMLFGMAHSFPQALAARVISGIGVAMIYVPALTAIRGACSAESFPLMTSLLFLFGNFGTICSKTPLAMLSEAVGWRHTHTILAVCGFVFAILVWIAVPDRNGGEENSCSGQKNAHAGNDAVRSDAIPMGQSEDPWAVVRSGRFLSLMVWFFIISGTISGAESLWDMTYLTEVQKLPYLQAVAIMTWAGVVATVTGPVVGALAKRRNTLMFASTSYLRAALFLIYAFLPMGLGFGTTAFWFVIKGLTMSCFPLAFAQARKIIPAKISGTLLGVSNTVAFLGGALFTQAMGIAVNGADKLGYDFIFTRIFLIFGVSILLVTTFVCVTNFKPGDRREACEKAILPS
ncbi:MFS transporter [Bacilliculturomica massiliensis]|uniref:MFS transporter n=1 Tax=Bacilliculturomica massiliensis TaxID=1917867 RepID=UPI001031B7C4|nr:MFS transporter [Bacilliculturomica massiliensis]